MKQIQMFDAGFLVFFKAKLIARTPQCATTKHPAYDHIYVASG